MAEKMQITNRYDDIISLPHHQSKTRPHMPLIDRAAQFSPFAALTGYDDAVKETARQTERKAELSEEMQACLQEKLQILQAQIPTKPTVRGEIKRIDEYRRVIVLLEEESERRNDVPEIERRKEISLEDLYEIEIL